jgi:hypothetical protein
VSRIYALIQQPRCRVPLNPDYGGRDNPEHTSAVIERFRTEDKDGEVMITERFDIPRSLKAEIVSEIRLIKESQNGPGLKYGTQSKCCHFAPTYQK